MRRCCEWYTYLYYMRHHTERTPLYTEGILYTRGALESMFECGTVFGYIIPFIDNFAGTVCMYPTT